VPGDHLLDVLGEVVPHVPPVRDLDGLRGAGSGAVGVGTGPVPADHPPADCTREQKVERVIALGASYLADHRRPDGSGWITLADSEGNEFCILSKDAAGSGPTT
jgi:hypothetical protein